MCYFSSCCVASSVRFYYLYSEITQSTAETGSDRYTKVTTAFTWGTVEPNASIIAACLPCYGPFFGRGGGLRSILDGFKSLWSSYSRGSRTSTKEPGKEIPNEAFPLQRSSRQWQLIHGSDNYNIKIDGGNDSSDDRLPFARDGRPIQINTMRDFSVQRQPATDSDPSLDYRDNVI